MYLIEALNKSINAGLVDKVNVPTVPSTLQPKADVGPLACTIDSLARGRLLYALRCCIGRLN